MIKLNNVCRQFVIPQRKPTISQTPLSRQQDPFASQPQQNTQQPQNIPQQYPDDQQSFIPPEPIQQEEKKYDKSAEDEWDIPAFLRQRNSSASKFFQMNSSFLLQFCLS